MDTGLSPRQNMRNCKDWRWYNCLLLSQNAELQSTLTLGSVVFTFSTSILSPRNRSGEITSSYASDLVRKVCLTNIRRSGLGKEQFEGNLSRPEDNDNEIDPLDGAWPGCR